MSYQKTTWSTGDTITAEKLNNIETGIKNNDDNAKIFITEITAVFDPQSGTISEATLGNTWQEIYDAMKTGVVFGRMEKRLNDTVYATSLAIIMVIGTDGETYFVEATGSGVSGFEADTPNDYPVMTVNA